MSEEVITLSSEDVKPVVKKQKKMNESVKLLWNKLKLMQINDNNGTVRSETKDSNARNIQNSNRDLPKLKVEYFVQNIE